MWVLIAVPLVVILMVLVSCYLQWETVLMKETLKARIMALIPAEPLYIAFLAVSSMMGIITFGIQYYDHSNFIWAAKLTTLVVLLAPISYIDFKTRKISNFLLLAGLSARAVFYIIEFFADNKAITGIITSDIKGLLLGGGIFLIGAVAAKNSIGMGDVKMFAVTGLFCGYTRTMTVIILSLFLCFVTAIILLLLKRKGLKDSVPLAPFVFAGTFLAMILGG
ncbi:MAG: hypothetical protein GX383_03385 [Clostridium sp.]|jgi:leader peptidase (prepilin peptidase)/N-methyltransferase|nr:hypothetical protein [Clostridium sp.]